MKKTRFTEEQIAFARCGRRTAEQRWLRSAARCRSASRRSTGLIEAFNGRLRAECLNENWFLSLEDAQAKIAAWRQHYNGDRPHSALGYLAPREFAAETRQASQAD